MKEMSMQDNLIHDEGQIIVPLNNRTVFASSAP